MSDDYDYSQHANAGSLRKPSSRQAEAMREYLAAQDAESVKRAGPKAAPGWYPHPSMVNTQRYWDGQQWTDHIAPGTTTPDRRPSAAVEGSSNGEGLMIAGIIMSLLFPIGGFIAGAVLLSRRPLAGALIVAVSFGFGLFFFFVGMDMIAAQQHQDCLLDNVDRAMQGVPARDCG